MSYTTQQAGSGCKAQLAEQLWTQWTRSDCPIFWCATRVPQ